MASTKCISDYCTNIVEFVPGTDIPAEHHCPECVKKIVQTEIYVCQKCGEKFESFTYQPACFECGSEETTVFEGFEGEQEETEESEDEDGDIL